MINILGVKGNQGHLYVETCTQFTFALRQLDTAYFEQLLSLCRDLA